MHARSSPVLLMFNPQGGHAFARVRPLPLTAMYGDTWGRAAFEVTWEQAHYFSVWRMVLYKYDQEHDTIH